NATLDGGGIYNDGSAAVRAFNATITNNQADSDFDGSGTGGGVFTQNSASFTVSDTILAANYETALFLGSWVPHTGECAGFVTTHESILENYNVTHCTPGGGTFTLADPKLEA